MEKLGLLFTQDGLQYQLGTPKKCDEQRYYTAEDTPEQYISEQLGKVLDKPYTSISVISAVSHFSLMPEGFPQHDMGYRLIGYNASVNTDQEELMLAVNKKYGIQFYYTLPREFYQKIKNTGKPANFNFSGERFLNAASPRGGKEIHINLYHNQCEFFALDGKKLLLYNNLDVNSEVDFLYFILFTLSKIGFGINETSFLVYGETTENETFISELRKFVKHIKIVFDNLPGKNFILN